MGVDAMASVSPSSLTAFFHDPHTEKPATLSLPDPGTTQEQHTMTLTLTLTDPDSNEYYWIWVTVVDGSPGAHSEHMAGDSGAGRSEKRRCSCGVYVALAQLARSEMR